MVTARTVIDAAEMMNSPVYLQLSHIARMRCRCFNNENVLLLMMSDGHHGYFCRAVQEQRHRDRSVGSP